MKCAIISLKQNYSFQNEYADILIFEQFIFNRVPTSDTISPLFCSNFQPPQFKFSLFQFFFFFLFSNSCSVRLASFAASTALSSCTIYRRHLTNSSSKSSISLTNFTKLVTFEFVGTSIPNLHIKISNYILLLSPNRTYLEFKINESLNAVSSIYNLKA